MEIKITLAQIPVHDAIDVNLKTIMEAVDQAYEDHADILLTPEGALSGYTHAFDAKACDEALDILTAYARERRVGLALGTCKLEDDGKRYNELRFYAQDGAYLGCHTKTLLCGTLEDEPRGEVRNFAVQPLRVFHFNGIPIGGLICNDMWANPCCTPMPDIHLSHCLAGMGAKIIFHAVNGGRDTSDFSQVTMRRFHEAHLLVKAVADNLLIATVDNAYPLDIGVSSLGGIVSPSGWAYQLPPIGRGVESVTVKL